MNDNSITEIDVTRALPPVLKLDKDMIIIADIIGRELQNNINLSRLNIIYARIDELEDEMLDILGYDLHVDWYDDSFSVEKKRQIIKDSVKVHKYLGTKYAVSTVLKSLFTDATIHEWFQYGGNPFTFKINLNISGSGMTTELQRKIVRQMFFYKNLRSHLDGLFHEYNTQGELYIGGYVQSHYQITVPPYIQSEYTSQGMLINGGSSMAIIDICVPPKNE